MKPFHDLLDEEIEQMSPEDLAKSVAVVMNALRSLYGYQCSEEFSDALAKAADQYEKDSYGRIRRIANDRADALKGALMYRRPGYPFN